MERILEVVGGVDIKVVRTEYGSTRVVMNDVADITSKRPKLSWGTKEVPGISVARYEYTGENWVEFDFMPSVRLKLRMTSHSCESALAAPDLRMDHGH